MTLHTISITTPINPPPPGVAIRTAIGTPRKSGVMAGRIVGQNNYRGNYIASDSATRYNVSISTNQHQNNEAVSLGRSDRNVHVISYTSRIATGPGQRSITSNKTVPDDIDYCDDGGSGGSSSSDAPEEPDRPKEPAPPPPPQEPAPEDPEKPPEEPAPSEGCYPESDCQWYNSASSSPSGCPAGTIYKGFADLGDGGFKLLCCGPDRPAGDGCPEDPASYGWSCAGGACALVPNGIYATQSECEGNCEPPPEEPLPPPDEPEPENPSLGGSCEGVLYNVYYTVKSTFDGKETIYNKVNNLWNISRSEMVGPVVYEGRVEYPARPNYWRYPTVVFYNIYFNGKKAWLDLSGSGSGNYIGPDAYGRISEWEVTDISIVRADGGPECS